MSQALEPIIQAERLLENPMKKKVMSFGPCSDKLRVLVYVEDNGLIEEAILIDLTAAEAEDVMRQISTGLKQIVSYESAPTT